MRVSIAGCEVRSSDSVQPVHSWNCSQMTEGLRPRSAASTKRSGRQRAEADGGGGQGADADEVAT